MMIHKLVKYIVQTLLGMATSDVGDGVAGFGLLVCDGSRLGTQMITFFFSLRTQI